MIEPFNEVIATVIMEKLNIPHIPYRLILDDEIPYSVCEDFITSDTEFVSARRIMLTAKQDSNTSLYRMYINCCETLGKRIYIRCSGKYAYTYERVETFF